MSANDLILTVLFKNGTEKEFRIIALRFYGDDLHCSVFGDETFLIPIKDIQSTYIISRENNKPIKPYSEKEYQAAKNLGLDLDDWSDYKSFFGLGEESEKM